MVTILKAKCSCGHEWVRRVPNPKQCPGCKKRWPLGRRDDAVQG